MKEVVIAGAVRTPIGAHGGALKSLRAQDLAEVVFRAVFERTGLDPALLDEVILGNKAHTFLYEAGGISALGGVHSCQLSNQPDGTLDLDDIRHAIRPDDAHQPITRLITLENPSCARPRTCWR